MCLCRCAGRKLRETTVAVLAVEASGPASGGHLVTHTVHDDGVEIVDTGDDHADNPVHLSLSSSGHTLAASAVAAKPAMD